MKILEYIENGNRVMVTVLHDDNTFTTLNMVNANDRENILKDVYIISKDERNRQQFEGEIPTDLEEWNPPKPIPTRMTVDFYNLHGKIYDQYGDEMDITPTFTIEGEHARIENGKIVEDAVTEDTSYFIVAKYGDLEERQERFLYAPVEPVPNELDMANHKINALVSEQEMTNDLLQEIILNMYQ